jgi:adenine-specific DNA-methyltransferase
MDQGRRIMSTGIPNNDFNHGTIKKKKVSISLDYDDKMDCNSILHLPHEQYELLSSVNGEGINRFYYGDNLDVLLSLLDSGYKNQVRLIYIDPPFSTESKFVNRQQEHAYSDILCGGEFVEFLRKRLIILNELLADDGSIYLHLDGKMAFAMKIIMDEIFGENNCRAFITRKKCSTKNYTRNSYGNISDYIMFYTKTSSYVWNRPYEVWDDERMCKQYPCIDNITGRRYKKVPVHAPGVRSGDTGKEWRGKLPPIGKHWQYTPKKLDELDAAGEIYWSPSGNPRRKVFFDSSNGVPVQDIWLNYRDSVNQSQKTTGYPTEKNLEMLKMIVEASSNPNDLVLDCFAGSGTTLDAAFQLQRRWIGVDNSIESLKAIIKRFTSGLEAYGDYVDRPKTEQLRLADSNGAKCPFGLYSQLRDKDVIQNLCQNISNTMDKNK